MKKKLLSGLAVLLINTIISVQNAYAQPANDDCLNATTVVPDGSCLIGETTVSATDTWSGAVGCQGGNPNDHQDVWYIFTATGTQADIICYSLWHMDWRY